MLTQILGGTAVVGVVAALWGRLKLISWRIINLLIVKARLESNLGYAILSYSWKYSKRSPFGEKRFGSMLKYIRPKDNVQDIGFEDISTDPMVFWFGWKPLVITYSMGEGKLGEKMGGSITITYIRGMFNLDDLIITCLDSWNDRKHGQNNNSTRFKVERLFGRGSPSRWSDEGKKNYDSPQAVEYGPEEYRNGVRLLKWKFEDLEAKKSPNTFSRLAFPSNVMQIVQRCERWLNSKDWYLEKEIPWRLGVLLYGIPGTGKTSLVRGIGQELNLPVFSFDLASFGNKDFESQWNNLQSNTPCIALLEDVDAIFDGRENKLGKNGGGLTFDCFLNVIGGIKESSGVLIFITTNRIQSLDEALGKPDMTREGMSTRPGRVDIAVELGILDEDCRWRIANRILKDCPSTIEATVWKGQGDTGCQFQERCSEIALAHYWGKAYETNGQLEHA